MADDIKDTEFAPEDTQDNGTQPSLWQRVQSTGLSLNDGYTRLCRNYENAAFFGGAATFALGNIGVIFASAAQGFGPNPMTAGFTAAALGGAVTFAVLNAIDRATGSNYFKLNASLAGATMVAQATMAGGVTLHFNDIEQRQAEPETLPQAQEIMSQEQLEAFKSGYCENSRRFMNPDSHKITFNGQDAIIDCTPSSP